MPKTYNELFLQVRRQLKAAEIPGHSLEARILVSAAAGKTKEQFTRDMGLYVGSGFEERVDGLLRRRLAGEPLAYITGRWEFYGIPVTVSRNVLIPRIDTEILAREAIELAKELPAGGRVLDLCCGSGAVGLAIAKHVPQIKLVLVDISQEAIQVSRSNVVLNKLAGQTACMVLDARKTPLRSLLGVFDMIVCNPPYIPSGDIQGLDRDVRDYEPALALDGGGDGLDFYRVIAREWRKILRPGGVFLFECGVGQAERVTEILEGSGMAETVVWKDTLGIDRVVAGRLGA